MFSLEKICEDVGVGEIMGGVTNHIKASMLHLLKDQRDLLTEDQYTGENTGYRPG